MGNLLTDSPRYRKFVADRDRALERIHQHAQMDIAQYMREFFKQTEMVVTHLALKTNHTLINFQTLSEQFNQQLGMSIKAIFPILLARIQRMRHAVYVLTYASEAEAIGQATQLISKPHHHSLGPDALGIAIPPQITKQDLHDAMTSPMINGESLDKRVWLDLQYLRSDILQAFELACVMEVPPHEILERVVASFPKLQVFTRAPKALKKAKEAGYNLGDDEDEKTDFTSTIMDDTDWDKAVSAYKDAELPTSRFEPGETFDEETGTFKYNWELEQDLTDDFVNQVRSGQVAAANDLGIEEFVWIAVIDDKTCEDCCLPRNGKTTGEIEEMLDNGDLDEDVCDAVTPPAHNHCRCNIGPVASTDEVEGADFKDFGEWLNS